RRASRSQRSVLPTVGELNAIRCPTGLHSAWAVYALPMPPSGRNGLGARVVASQTEIDCELVSVTSHCSSPLRLRPKIDIVSRSLPSSRGLAPRMSQTPTPYSDVSDAVYIRDPSRLNRTLLPWWYVQRLEDCDGLG